MFHLLQCLQAFGESEVCPLNTVVHRIVSGNSDQTLIGDKLIWFSDQVCLKGAGGGGGGGLS